MRSDPLAMVRLADWLATEGNFPMEILASICFHSIRTSRLLAFHIHRLRDFSVRITLWTSVLRVFSRLLVMSHSLAFLRRDGLLKILHLSGMCSRESVKGFLWVSLWQDLTLPLFFELILLYMRSIMTLERIKQQIGSIFSVEILHLALDDSQVVVFRVNL